MQPPNVADTVQISFVGEMNNSHLLNESISNGAEVQSMISIHLELNESDVQD